MKLMSWKEREEGMIVRVLSCRLKYVRAELWDDVRADVGGWTDRQTAYRRTDK